MKHWTEHLDDQRQRLKKENMKKLIDIPEEIVIPLKVKAAKANKDLKNYIQDLLITEVKSK